MRTETESKAKVQALCENCTMVSREQLSDMGITYQELADLHMADLMDGIIKAMTDDMKQALIRKDVRLVLSDGASKRFPWRISQPDIPSLEAALRKWATGWIWGEMPEGDGPVRFSITLGVERG